MVFFSSVVVSKRNTLSLSSRIERAETEAKRSKDGYEVGILPNPNHVVGHEPALKYMYPSQNKLGTQ